MKFEDIIGGVSLLLGGAALGNIGKLWAVITGGQERRRKSLQLHLDEQSAEILQQATAATKECKGELSAVRAERDEEVRSRAAVAGENVSLTEQVHEKNKIIGRLEKLLHRYDPELFPLNQPDAGRRREKASAKEPARAAKEAVVENASD